MLNAAEIKELQRQWRKLVKVLGNRPRPPQRILDARYREIMGRSQP